MKHYKSLFDHALLTSTYDRMTTHQRTLLCEFDVAVNACFCLDRDLAGNLLFDTTKMRGLVPQFYLNILPRPGSITVVISYFKDDEPTYGRLVRDMLALPVASFLSVLSYFTVEFCENWAIRPSIVSQWSSRKREKIESRFRQSLAASADYLSFVRDIGDLCMSD